MEFQVCFSLFRSRIIDRSSVEESTNNGTNSRRNNTRARLDAYSRQQRVVFFSDLYVNLINLSFGGLIFAFKEGSAGFQQIGFGDRLTTAVPGAGLGRKTRHFRFASFRKRGSQGRKASRRREEGVPR